MKKKIVVIYHRADFDGIFCREVARKFLPEAELIGWDYADPTPAKETLGGAEMLFMLDISIPDLMGHPKLVWIDHHKSAMEKYDHGIPGYRIDGVAACRLAWQWFSAPGPLKHLTLGKSDFIDRTVKEPLAVRLAGEYDIWDKRDPNAELFQHGLRSQDFDADHWEMLLSPQQYGSDGREDIGTVFVHALLDQGRCLQYAKANENKSVIKRLGYTVKWEGLTFLACNHALFNSHLFTAGIRPDHDALLGFKYDGMFYHVSLYHAPGKEQHDLSVIATKYGGGGHRGACGFRTDKMIWQS